MLKRIILLSSIFLFHLTTVISQPYSGTIFIDSTILTATDVSTIQSTVYSGRGMRTVYDRRVPGWISINAYLFNITWDDGITSEAQINPEFGSVGAATIEAEKYAEIIGRLPACLRADVNAIWVHLGTELFGGGNHSILIHTGQTAIYESQGILEETLIHEATHTSLDAAYAASAGWLAAQANDPFFISDYAELNPTSEDVAESFLTWIAVRQCSIRISQQNYDTISADIPNRLSYFDQQNFNMYPLCMLSTTIPETTQESFSVYPNPAREMIMIHSAADKMEAIELYSVDGRKILHKIIRDFSASIDLRALSKGIYYLIVLSEEGKRSSKMLSTY